MKKGKAILAVMAGIAAGAAIGLLFAPDKGEKIKLSMLKRKAQLADLLGKRIESRFDALMAEVDERRRKAGKNGEYATRSEMPV